MRPHSLFARAVIVAAGGILVAACGASDTTGDEDAAGETSAAAYTGTLAELKVTSASRGSPASWPQPDSEGIVGQNGYCGATAAANLLRWYDREVSPRQAIDGGCWSYIGTRPAQLGKYMENTSPDLGCKYRTMPYDAPALANLRAAFAAGRPVAVVFMTGALNAHWVTVVGVRGAGEHPALTVMSWGKYYSVGWDEFKDAWRRAWGGYYPHVICEAISPHAGALTAE